MKYTPILTFFMSLLMVSIALSQTTDDALRYAVYEAMGTSRSMSIGNALSSLGGDFFTMSHNPAGLATYRRSELTLTPALQSTRVNASLKNNPTYEEVDNDFMVSNIGLVIAHTNTHSKWKTVNFGIGYNRHTNFDRQVYYSGTTQGSITDQWLEEYQNSDELLPYSAGLASGADIFVENSFGQIATDYEFDGRLPQKKQENISSTGGHGEMVVGFAANYDHKIYFGLTLGIPIVSYELNRQYQENQEMVDNSIFFDQLNYNERLEQSGAGINAKLGMIYRVNQMLRLSAYYHTPSVISLLDEFNNSLDYSYYDQNRNIVTATNSYPPNGETLNFEYQIVTPGQVGGGASVIIGKGGFVSGEVSYTNYSSARFDFDSDLSTSDDLEYERELNQRIDDTYGGAWTFRLGGELALDILRFRLGTILTQRPFANDNKLDPTYTGGLGLRFNKFFVDFAYRRATRKASYSPYTIADQNTFPVQKVSTEDINSDYFLTFGFRF